MEIKKTENMSSIYVKACRSRLLYIVVVTSQLIIVLWN